MNPPSICIAHPPCAVLSTRQVHSFGRAAQGEGCNRSADVVLAALTGCRDGFVTSSQQKPTRSAKTYVNTVGGLSLKRLHGCFYCCCGHRYSTQSDFGRALGVAVRRKENRHEHNSRQIPSQQNENSAVLFRTAYPFADALHAVPIQNGFIKPVVPA